MINIKADWILTPPEDIKDLRCFYIAHLKALVRVKDEQELWQIIDRERKEVENLELLYDEKGWDRVKRIIAVIYRRKRGWRK